MRMSEKCRNNKHNNSSDNTLTSRQTDGGKNLRFFLHEWTDYLFIISAVTLYPQGTNDP